MTYLDLLIAGYRTGLVAPIDDSLEHLQLGLATVMTPTERGFLLGALAAAMAHDTDMGRSTPEVTDNIPWS